MYIPYKKILYIFNKITQAIIDLDLKTIFTSILYSIKKQTHGFQIVLKRNKNIWIDILVLWDVIIRYHFYYSKFAKTIWC